MIHHPHVPGRRERNAIHEPNYCQVETEVNVAPLANSSMTATLRSLLLTSHGQSLK